MSPESRRKVAVITAGTLIPLGSVALISTVVAGWVGLSKTVEAQGTQITKLEAAQKAHETVQADSLEKIFGSLAEIKTDIAVIKVRSEKGRK